VENFTIEVAQRTDLGKGACNRCRKAGFIPGVAYHRADEPVAVQVSYKEFTMLAKKARMSQVFTFKSGNPALNGKSAIVKDVQQDYLKGKVLHVDFQTLKDDEEITVYIPVSLVGEAPGVKVQNGILTLVTHEIAVSCLPKNIPNQLQVDISNLGLGQSIHASDLKLGDGVTLSDDPHETIVSVVAARTAEDEAKAAGSAEGAPAAAAAPAEGAKPAAK
jgi:large subunit ribosomal protein L25